MARKVEGQRSPRWAIWKRMTIPCHDGIAYLARLRIIQTPWFGIYLHDIYEFNTTVSDLGAVARVLQLLADRFGVERILARPEEIEAREQRDRPVIHVDADEVADGVRQALIQEVGR